jgi:predicted oxidoreductase
VSCAFFQKAAKNLTSKEMENMIHVCVENKITSFDHADIYGSYTPKQIFLVLPRQNSERENAINI